MFKLNFKKNLESDIGLPYCFSTTCYYVSVYDNMPQVLKKASESLIKNNYVVGSDSSIELAFEYDAINIWLRRHSAQLEAILKRLSKPGRLNLKKLGSLWSRTFNSARKHK